MWAGHVGLLSAAGVAKLRERAPRESEAAAASLAYAKHARGRLYDVLFD
ncbi:MAG: hypothetical protein ACR2L9_03125 [Solirubrobacteraceae bacterium]